MMGVGGRGGMLSDVADDEEERVQNPHFTATIRI